MPVPISDLTLAELEAYKPHVYEPEDFDEFWSRTLAEARGADGEVVLRPAKTPVTELDILDLTFPGYGGEPVHAWLTRPKGASGRLPAVIEYNGYNGGFGIAGERLQWAASGYVHLFMDTRGQGSGWGSGGTTGDPHGSGPSVAGFMTKGISNPDDYYYRRLFTDAVRLVDAVAGLDFVDPQRIAVTGGSQGGGMSLAVAGLVPQVLAVMPDVPFLCHFRRAVEITPSGPFPEIAQYLAVHRNEVARVFETLGYFDGVNFARRIAAPALFSVALMDEVVMPSTVFAAYNHLATDDAAIEVYPFNAHEGGQSYQWLRQAEWLADRVG
ncbi:MAG: acetylxylan esterase [Rhodoglobus sp.]|nr:acetylxylan esterase [Rhodoglobus sp.]